MNSKTVRNLTIISLIIVVLVVVIGILLTANRSGTDNTPVDQVGTGVDFRDSFSTAAITTDSFADATAFEKATQNQVSPQTDLLFLPSNQLAYLSVDRNLAIQNTVVSAEQKFNPLSMYNTSDGIIINNHNEIFAYQNNGQTLKLPSDVISMIPYQNQYLYLEKNRSGEGFVFKTTDNITLGLEPEVVGEIVPNSSFEVVELKEIAGDIYVLFYNNNFKTIEIWQYEDGQARNFRSLNDVFSFKILSDHILYTEFLSQPNEVTNLGTNLLDLTNPATPITQELVTTTPLGQERIFGDVVAERCDFDGEKLLYCLVKRLDVPHTFSAEQDAIFTYDITNSRIEFPFSSLALSGERVFVSPDKDVYITTSTIESNDLFKLKK